MLGSRRGSGDGVCSSGGQAAWKLQTCMAMGSHRRRPLCFNHNWRSSHQWRPAFPASRHEQTPSTHTPRRRVRAHPRCTAQVCKDWALAMQQGVLPQAATQSMPQRPRQAAPAKCEWGSGITPTACAGHAPHLHGPRRTSYSRARTTSGVTSGSRSGSSRPRRASSASPRHPPCQAVSLDPAGRARRPAGLPPCTLTVTTRRVIPPRGLVRMGCCSPTPPPPPPPHHHHPHPHPLECARQPALACVEEGVEQGGNDVVGQVTRQAARHAAHPLGRRPAHHRVPVSQPGEQRLDNACRGGSGKAGYDESTGHETQMERGVDMLPAQVGTVERTSNALTAS